MWISTVEEILTPTAIALGNFDGIHRGHRQILAPILSLSQLKAQAVYPTVVSFNPHPRQFFTGKKVKLLTPITEKTQQLEQIGIQQLVLLPFNRKLATLSPQEFVTEIVVKQLQATFISIGKDFHFGYQRQGTAADLQAIAAQFDIQVQINSLYKYQNQTGEDIRISSSLIRQALQSGEIEQANLMLGRPYNLQGRVVQGQQLGRTIGFPTANLELPPDKFLPRYGVYSVNVLLEESQGEKSSNQPEATNLRGVMNIGCRPTVDGNSNSPTIEVHLLDWSGDLYGKTLKVGLERFLRPEQKFSSLEALKQQIAADCEAAKYCLS